MQTSSFLNLAGMYTVQNSKNYGVFKYMSDLSYRGNLPRHLDTISATMKKVS